MASLHRYGSLSISICCFMIFLSPVVGLAQMVEPPVPTAGYTIEPSIQDSPPQPPKGAVRPVVTSVSRAAVMLEGVPTSTWTYGCSATAAGMLFGYYDRHGYPNMYTGPANGGVAPLIDLGQGDDPLNPIGTACSIIATQNGFDGRTIPGHVDDYWISYESEGPDPWEAGGVEHTWGDCTADYMGTNQWKWNVQGSLYCSDGATVYWTRNDGGPLYDPIPDASYGLPQTACCHGMRLFAESRGYTVLDNYNQRVDTLGLTYGFTFEEYMAEIDAGRPVLIHISGHTMTGVGYEAASQLVYLHDTWDNHVHSMYWGGTYAGRLLRAVTVLRLEIIDCNDNGILDSDDQAACTGEAWCSDCNGNGLLDECDVDSGVYPDCNSNGVPDECDIQSNGIADCNENHIPDECEVPGLGDFNNDMLIDEDDLSAFVDCLAGPGSVPGPQQPVCVDLCLEVFDADGDDDVDLYDFSVLQTMMLKGASTEGMVLVPAGEYAMGDSLDEGFQQERPVQQVYVDAFFIDKTVVTNQQYSEALNWAYLQGLIAVQNGVVSHVGSGENHEFCTTSAAPSGEPHYGEYSKLTWDGNQFGVFSGYEDYPMIQVSWYGAAAYSNWRSEMEGLPTSYDITTWDCNFGEGYRLPTEAEWEKTARGGEEGLRFPWGDADTIQHSRANYISHENYSYDTSPTRGHHPAFEADGYPYTNPVGYFDSTGYGVFDIAGNVWEWCNDWYGSRYYGEGRVYDNPIGPEEGGSRVIRGGAGSNYAIFCRCSSRHYDDPAPRYTNLGFRLVRIPVFCEGDDACDDGLFCNGREYCQGGVCVSDPDPCGAGLGCDEVFDQCFEDCNANDIPDGDDLISGTSQDCNTNSILDECDIADGTSTDYNSNLVPDECEDPAAIEMVLIPGGEFQMGDTFDEGDANEKPVHAVNVDDFHIGKTEITNFQYMIALNWAYGQGLVTVSSGIVYQADTGAGFPYCDTTDSSSSSRIVWDGSTFAVVEGMENHPMLNVSWYGAAAYCNWRSQMMGRAVCYDWATWVCSFDEGYRLPTEAEWEKAARGGSVGQRFPWDTDNTIQHSLANYWSSESYSYDVSLTRGFHPDFVSAAYPYSSPAGYLGENEYGLKDMAGNAFEWCNDWYSFSAYSDSDYENPRGPESGTARIARGGSWASSAVSCRVAHRKSLAPDYLTYTQGFRLVLESAK